MAYNILFDYFKRLIQKCLQMLNFQIQHWVENVKYFKYKTKRYLQVWSRWCGYWLGYIFLNRFYISIKI